jgi:hypothetical protein
MSNFVTIHEVFLELHHADLRTEGQIWRSKQSTFLADFQVRHGTILTTACGKVGINVQARLFFEILLQKIPFIFNT